MADAKKTLFRRPEQPASPAANRDAEAFIRGTDHAPKATRVEPASPPVAAPPQGGKETPKPEAMKRLTIDIPEGLHKRVKSQCGAQGTTIADVVRAFLEKKFPEPKA